MYPARWFDISWLNPRDFFNESDGLVFEALGQVIAEEASANPITIKARLEQLGTWPRVGAAHLAHILQEGAVTEPLVDRLAEIVADKAKLRRVLATCHVVVQEAYGPIENDLTWAEDVPGRLDAAVRATTTTDFGVTARDGIIELFQEWQSTDPSARIRLETGLPDLDRLFRGMRPQQLVVIGAHSGIGKSVLAAQIATHVALYQQPGGTRAGVYIQSIEMSFKEYLERMIFAYARVDTYKHDEERRDSISADEWTRITMASEALSRGSVWIDDKPDLTPSQIRTRVKRQKLRFERAGTPLRLVIVDYAQIVSGDTDSRRRHDTREQEVAQVPRAMKNLAKELDITVLLLAQLNEDSAKEKRKPRASDLRESRSLKHDANKVVLVYNPYYVDRIATYRNGEPWRPLPREHVDFLIEKNRGGRTGTVAATYHPSFTLFCSFEGTPEELAQLRDQGTTVRGRR